MVYVAAQPVSGAGVAAADELAEPAGSACRDGGADTRHSRASPRVPAEGVVSAKSWAIVALGAIALCVVVGLALAAKLDFVLIGLAIIAALVATYLVGRRDNPDGDS